MHTLRIGKLADRLGTPAPPIRYYEEIGLRRATRRAGSQRVYGAADVEPLAFIRPCGCEPAAR